MLITKYAQACLTVTVDNETLIIDPGSFTGTLDLDSPVVGIVYTHEHVDHVDPALLREILAQHPTATVYAPSSVAELLSDFEVDIVHPHDTVIVSPFTLTFTGGTHASILPEVAPVDNVGVLVNDVLYYPGDSYALPPHDIDTLALPTSGPWFKLSDSVAFAAEVHPKQIFPTHDYLNSAPGVGVVERWLRLGLEPLGIDVRPLAIGDQINIIDRPLKLT